MSATSLTLNYTSFIVPLNFYGYRIYQAKSRLIRWVSREKRDGVTVKISDYTLAEEKYSISGAATTWIQEPRFPYEKAKFLQVKQRELPAHPSDEWRDGPVRLAEVIRDTVGPGAEIEVSYAGESAVNRTYVLQPSDKELPEFQDGVWQAIRPNPVVQLVLLLVSSL